MPWDAKQAAAEAVMVVLTSTPCSPPTGVGGKPSTQHCTSEGPEQYPGTAYTPEPEQAEVCMQVPEPEGVEQRSFVQHLMSEDPGHRPEVVVPVEQHPPEMLTQAPV
jgi:hypothetical protein